MGAPTRARWRRREALPGFVAMAVLGGILLSAALGLSLGAWLTTGKGMTPVDVIQGFTNHKLEFTGSYFAAMGAVMVALGSLVTAVILWWRKNVVPASWVDVAAQHMASPKEAASLSRKAVEEKARKLGVKGTGK